MKRIVCMFFSLILLLLPILSSCGNGNSGDDTKSPNSKAPTDTDKPSFADDLPDDLKFDQQEILIACRGGTSWEMELNEFEPSDGIVNHAVYQRNMLVQDRLAVQLRVIPGAVEQAQYMGDIQRLILGGSCEYDIVAGSQYLAATMTLENCWRNLSDAPYLNYEKEYWHNEYMDNLSINTHTRYMLAGDIALSKIGWTSCLYYNKDIYNAVFAETMGRFEDRILNYDWTLEDLMEMCAEVTDETDHSENAMIGMMTNNESMCDRITISMGIEFSTRDSEGYPYITLNQEKTENFVSRVLKIFKDAPGFVLADSEGHDLNKFVSKQALFGNGTLYTAMLQLKNDHVDVNYGIIPWPLYESGMTEYHAAVQDNIALYMVPMGVADSRMEMVCAVLEAMCSETYRSVTPKLYESALKTQYAPDDVYGQIVDLIYKSATTDILYVYSYDLNRIGQFMRAIAKGQYESFSSWWGSNGDYCGRLLIEVLSYLEEE